MPNAVKIVVIGPIKTGKTIISNFLADATEISSDYRPTPGVRILEFEVSNLNEQNERNKQIDVELWDCSGDFKYENCWPAMRKDLHGVIFVCNKSSHQYVKELEILHNYFVVQSQLASKNCLVFFYDPDKNSGDLKPLSNTFASISHVTCDVEEGASKLKTDFQAYLRTLTSKIVEK